MNDQPRVLSNYHIEKITKKYITDYLNALLFSNVVLWDGVDQFNEMPIFYESTETGYRVEQRGGLFVDKRTTRALRMCATAIESNIQKVCYRITSLKEPYRIDEGNRLYYPLDGVAIDVSIADASLGSKDPSSYSFCDNTDNAGNVTVSRLFAILRHLIGSAFLAIDDQELFKDMINDPLSMPPIPSEAHYKPVFGVRDAVDSDRD
jgi:hypothetical protein